MLKLGWVGLWTVLVVGSLSAQQEAAPVAASKPATITGMVSGQVTCGDTNLPARFAVVTLEAVPVDGAPHKDEVNSETAANQTVMTDLEGRFVLDKIPVGRYFLWGNLAGYLNPLARFEREELQKMTEETRKELAAALPLVVVDATRPAAVTLKLQRGAEIGGTVTYDDGSPAVGLPVQLLRKKKDGVLVEFSEGRILATEFIRSGTDDRGHYRIVGIPEGEYAVTTSLRAEKIQFSGLLRGETSVMMRGGQAQMLAVYSGNVFRLKEAKIRKVDDGEEVADADLIIPLSGLQKLNGGVTAKRDSHGVNKAHVELMFADDREVVRSADVDGDGNFSFAYVPEEKYILRVTGAADVEEVEEHPSATVTNNVEKVVRGYGEAELPVTVEDGMGEVGLVVPDLAGKPE